MPRTDSLSGRTDELPIPCRPSARTVARFRAMWLIVLLVWVTRSLPGIGSLPARADRRRGLARDDETELDAALAAELLDGAKAHERVEGGTGHVDRVGRPVHLAQDVPDPGRLDDGADG